MITYESLHHVSLAVTDLDVARQFYREVLCLTEVNRPNFHNEGAWFEIGQQQVHLIVYPKSQALRKDKRIDSDDGHFALRINNYDEAIKHFESFGINYVCNPRNLAGWAQIYICDPDGNTIELNVLLGD